MVGNLFSPEEKSPTLFATISLIELEPLSVLLFNSHMVYGQHKNFIDLSPAVIVLAKLVEYDKPVLALRSQTSFAFGALLMLPRPDMAGQMRPEH